MVAKPFDCLVPLYLFVRVPHCPSFRAGRLPRALTHNNVLLHPLECVNRIRQCLLAPEVQALLVAPQGDV
jgi:hypothetical protein